MAITTLNTKIKLRYDTFANWESANPVLLKGEVAVVEVAQNVNATNVAGNPATVNENSYKPTILFKVGTAPAGTQDNETTKATYGFKVLPWASGLAADVYAWAKKAQAETGDNMKVTGLTQVAGGNHADITDKNGTTLNSVIQDIYDQFNSLTGGNGSIADQIKGALADLVNTAANQTSGTVGVSDATSKYVTGLTISSDANGVKRLELVEGTLPTVTDAQATTGSAMTDNDGDTVVTSVTQTKGQIAVTKQSLGLGTAARKDAATTAIADDSADTNLVSAAQVATYVQGKVDNYIDKVDTLIGDDDDKSVRTIANEELAAQLIPANAQEALDTLQEIAAWIQAHPDDASAMNDAITALQTHAGLVNSGASRLTKTVDVSGTPTVQQATVKEYVDNAISDVDADITALQTKTELGTYDNNGTPTEYATVKAYVEAEIDTVNDTIDALDDKVEAIETDIGNMDYTVGAPEITVANQTDTAFVNVLTGFEVENGDLKANTTTSQTLAKVATTGSINDLIQETTIILDGGNAAGTFGA